VPPCATEPILKIPATMRAHGGCAIHWRHVARNCVALVVSACACRVPMRPEARIASNTACALIPPLHHPIFEHRLLRLFGLATSNAVVSRRIVDHRASRGRRCEVSCAFRSAWRAILHPFRSERPVFAQTVVDILFACGSIIVRPTRRIRHLVLCGCSCCGKSLALRAAIAFFPAALLTPIVGGQVARCSTVSGLAFVATITTFPSTLVTPFVSGVAAH